MFSETPYGFSPTNYPNPTKIIASLSLSLRSSLKTLPHVIPGQPPVDGPHVVPQRCWSHWGLWPHFSPGTLESPEAKLGLAQPGDQDYQTQNWALNMAEHESLHSGLSQSTGSTGGNDSITQLHLQVLKHKGNSSYP